MKLGNNTRRKAYYGTLAAQIKATEVRLFNRQRRAYLHTNTLLQDLQKEITSPTTLLLIGELGFVIGELTKRPSKNKRQPVQSVQLETDGASQAADDVTPLKKIMEFGGLMMTVYQALPLAWLMETFHQQDKSKTEAVKAKPPPNPPPSSI